MLSKAIEVNDLEKIFGKGNQKVHAVKGITLSINQGELFGFLGPNGAGKTTSLKMMIGLLEPTHGNVNILGKDPKISRKDLMSEIGIIPQDINLYYDLTVEENLKFIASIYKIPSKVAKKRIDGLIKKVGLEEKKKALVKNLSGGQRRRVNLIMSLIHDPNIILCDEPTPGLDPQSRVVVWDFIKDLVEKDKKTVVLTTHFMEEADRLCDRVAIIDHGNILVIDEPGKLKSSIGEGDLLELKLSNNTIIQDIRLQLSEFPGVAEVLITKDTAERERITLRCLDVIPKISKILKIIETKGVEVVNMRIRHTTLEDVFISLTGRSLRD